MKKFFAVYFTLWILPLFGLGFALGIIFKSLKVGFDLVDDFGDWLYKD